MATDTKRIAVLGATGSIGRQALEVIERLDAVQFGGTRWQVQSLTADSSIDELAELARKYHPAAVACGPTKAAALGELLADTGIAVLAGEEGLAQLAKDPAADIVLMAIYGLDAIAPLLTAVEHGKRIALASKEALVAAGGFIMEAARRRGATILPVDSEHSAVFQCLQGLDPAEVRRVILTASGGPFRGMERQQLENVTYEQAQHHPVWEMGAGITLNSATLFNKGLEVIEAHHLFGLAAEKIDVVVHPEGRVHGMVELTDGSLLLQAAEPDMRTPIEYACTWPLRSQDGVAPLDLESIPALTFGKPDDSTFPALQACRQALNGQWWLPAALIAANEQLCERFRVGNLPFLAIGDLLAELVREPSALGLGEVPQELHQVWRVQKSAIEWAGHAVCTAPGTEPAEPC